MAHRICIYMTLVAMFLTHGLGYADGEANDIDPPVSRADRLVISVGRPLSTLLAEVDEGDPAVNRQKETGPESNKPSPPFENKPQSEKKQPNRALPLKATPPSEVIKADQAVDFPYDI